MSTENKSLSTVPYWDGKVATEGMYIAKLEAMMDRRCEEMKQSLVNMVTTQLATSNAEMTKCVSDLSKMVCQLDSKVSSMNGKRRLDSNEGQEQCEEELYDTMEQEGQMSSSTSSNENAGGEKNKKRKTATSTGEEKS